MQIYISRFFTNWVLIYIQYSRAIYLERQCSSERNNDNSTKTLYIQDVTTLQSLSKIKWTQSFQQQSNFGKKKSDYIHLHLVRISFRENFSYVFRPPVITMFFTKDSTFQKIVEKIEKQLTFFSTCLCYTILTQQKYLPT